MGDTENKGEVTSFILRAMTNAILGSPDFGGYASTPLQRNLEQDGLMTRDIGSMNFPIHSA